jgi:formylglycine-generating enzyme required for sulfatase activity
MCQALEQGNAMIFLDGLDEIPTAAQRTFVRDAVMAFERRYPGVRLLATCRTLSYQDPAWQLAESHSFELAAFDEKKIDRFIGAWYDELARLGMVKTDEAAGLAQRLRDAVRRTDLWRLAPNPLLLTVMALVHTHKGRLPDARSLLYEETVDILLWRWEQIKAGGDEEAPRLRRLLMEAGRTDVDLKRVIWQLAYQAHQEGGAEDTETLADIGELELQKALAGLHPVGSRDWAHQVIQTMKLRAGLLLERAPDIFTFPHRTFQEYLAGAHLSAQADFATHAAHLLAEGLFWREVVLLAVGRLVYLGGDTAKPLFLTAELCPVEAVDTEPAWLKAWIAGDVLLEIGLNRVRDSALGRDLNERVRLRLPDLLNRGRLSPVERAAAGKTLANLGDPRPGVGVIPGTEPALPDMQFCYVPGGPFWMGSEENEDEKPLHLNKCVDYGYWIARYPVTGAQFKAFVEASGYEPVDQCSLRGPDNHPVTYVTWYDALAFCQRLRDVWREGGNKGLKPLAEGFEVRLPSEAEWEKAARGGLQIPDEPTLLSTDALDGGARCHVPSGDNPQPKRPYPWGDVYDPNRANCDQTGIGSPTSVGIFPEGASPYGCLDMAGNVWEWTRSLWGKSWEKPDFRYPYDPDDGRESLEAGREVRRILKGGAFYSSESPVRCASRRRSRPVLQEPQLRIS